MSWNQSFFRALRGLKGVLHAAVTSLRRGVPSSSPGSFVRLWGDTAFREPVTISRTVHRFHLPRQLRFPERLALLTGSQGGSDRLALVF